MRWPALAHTENGPMTTHVQRTKRLIVSVVCLVLLVVAGCSAMPQSNQSGADPQSQPVTSDDGNSGSTTSDGAVVTGLVTDASGNPLGEATVTVPRGSVAVPEMAVITSSDGSYQWDLPAGTFTLEVHKDGYATASAEVNIAASESITQDFMLQKQ